MNVRDIKDRFLRVNEERLKRMRSALHVRQRAFLDVLPLLFHSNHPALPGFFSEDTPMGVSDYWETPAALQAARTVSREFDQKRQIPRTCEIHSLFLMGSTGTVAQSRKSDFDIWVCHGPELERGRVAALREKCLLIERWADGLGLEVHFFLMESESFRAGKLLDLSSESSGSAQHHLLLDEFYRTSLLLAGRSPAWWLVPPEQEVNYDDYLAALVQTGSVSRGEIIDFGGLGQIPAEEFFGAAVWQLYKGIDSPYKSVLKIMLMECYANEYPRVQTLSMRFKSAVYAGEEQVDRLDPYLMLVNRLTEYLRERNEPRRLELVRRCAYFKINLGLSKLLRSEGTGWRRDLVSSLIKDWGWSPAHLQQLDTRSSWKIDRVVDERKILVEELTQSYFSLSGFARTQASLAMISQKDLTLLGRKLYAAFERKAGKIELVNPGISADVHEDMLTLGCRYGRDGRESWALYRDTGNPLDVNEAAPLKRAPSLMELLIWCYFNRIIDSRTIFSLQNRTNSLGSKELYGIIDSLNELYPGARLPDLAIEDLAQPPRLAAAALFVNVGKDPGARGGSTGHVIGNSIDAIGYTGLHEDLIGSCDILYSTSWHELLTYRHLGLDGLLDALCQYLQWAPLQDSMPPPPIKVICFTPTYGERIAQRVNELFTAIRSVFFERAERGYARYLLEVERNYHLIYSEDATIKRRQLRGEGELMRLLCAPQPQYSSVVIDRHALGGTALPLIYQHNRPGLVQLFYGTTRDELHVYVLDERGTLYHDRMALDEPVVVVSHYIIFLTSILKRLPFALRDAADGTLLELYHLRAEVPGRYAVERKNLQRMPEAASFSVQVIGDTAGAESTLSIYSGGEEFSSFDHGPQLYHAVARHVLAQRRNGKRYPIYITDIDVAPTLLGAESAGYLQTAHYLEYKRRIERELNQAMLAL